MCSKISARFDFVAAMRSPRLLAQKERTTGRGGYTEDTDEEEEERDKCDSFDSLMKPRDRPRIFAVWVYCRGAASLALWLGRAYTRDVFHGATNDR